VSILNMRVPFTYLTKTQDHDAKVTDRQTNKEGWDDSTAQNQDRQTKGGNVKAPIEVSRD